MFSDEELRDIAELRERLTDVMESESSSYGKSFLEEDATMWRYILAKSRDENPMSSSETMFRSSVLWRESIDMPNLIKNWRQTKCARARLGDLCFYGGLLEKRSVNNGPVLIERLGKVDLPGLFSDKCNANMFLFLHVIYTYISYYIVALDCACLSYAVYLEEAWNIVRAAGGKVRGIIIIDIAGYGFNMLGYIPIIKQLTSSGVLNYPEITEKVYMINAGWFITTVWNTIKPFLPTRTEAKFEILSAVDVSQLGIRVYGNDKDGLTYFPSFLGGQASDALVCPARSVHEAYLIVIQEILTEEVFYPDAMEFLQHAITYLDSNSTMDVSNKIEYKQQIQDYISKKL